MKKALEYSTKYIENALKQHWMRYERVKQELRDDKLSTEIRFQRLDQQIAEQKYDWIIDSLTNVFHGYASDGDFCWQLDGDIKKAKENYYIATLIGALIYEMLEKGFSHHVSDSGHPYDFKQHNFAFSKTAILANEYELALKISGEDTIEGALIMQDYEQACSMLPENPEDDSISAHEIHQCMWAIAHRDEKLFQKYIEKRIKTLRRYARLNTIVFDSWGLAVVKLAQRRGLACNINVIELPHQSLDDNKVDTSGLVFPREEQIRSIIDSAPRLFSTAIKSKAER